MSPAEHRPDAAPKQRPRLSAARCELMREVEVVDAGGQRRRIQIPDERALTLYVDKRELVTLMTLGQAPELLALGYLLNQNLIGDVAEIESVTVDWGVHSAALRSHAGLAESAAWQAKTARRTVTTGCGQGTVFGDMMTALETRPRPAQADARVEQATLVHVLQSMRERDSVYRRAGSVHGAALWCGRELLYAVEDVGRHNAVDTLAGWMAMNSVAGADKLLYSTGRLTSEIVVKAAHLGVPILVSRNGITAMGLDLAQRLGLTLIGRAANRRFICYCGAGRLRLEGASVSV